MTDRPTSNDYPELTERDAELLSAYIDDMLTDDERTALEARLENEPFLARELVAMRQTVAWINELPTFRAPHDFTLTVEQAEAIRPRVVAPAQVTENTATETLPSESRVIRFPANTGWLVASAAAMFVLVFGAVFLLNGGNTPQADTAVFSGESAADEAAEVAVLPTSTLVPTALPLPPSDGAGVGGASVDSVVVTIDQTKEPDIITQSAEAQAPIAEVNAESATAQMEATAIQYNATSDAVALSTTATPIATNINDATASVAQASADEDADVAEADMADAEEAPAVDNDIALVVDPQAEDDSVEAESVEEDVATARSADDDVVVDEAEDMADDDFGADESMSAETTTTEAIMPSPLQRAFALVVALIETLTGIMNR
ncbi:MAG: hypothetical protein AAFN11_01070 [Chloroflexota bacterium]